MRARERGHKNELERKCSMIESKRESARKRVRESESERERERRRRYDARTMKEKT